MQRKLIITSVILISLIGAPTLWGQAVGGIFGTVVDPTGAPIPNANVTAVNKDTAFARSTLSGSFGTYSLSGLPIGIYTLKIGAPGFETANADNIALDVNRNREMNVTLGLAGVATAVNVSATAPLLDAADSTLSGLVTAEQITSLPLETRDVVGLVFLQPGVHSDPVETAFHQITNGTFSSNGSSPLSGGSYLDGVPTTDFDLGGGQFTNLNLDAIAEFRVLQNDYSAQYGQGSGSIVVLASKSGSNQFHGSAFEFIRNDKFMGTRNWFNTSIPPLRKSQFGGTIGGPLRKNHTYFFGQYAGMREVFGAANFLQVPTSDQRNGIVDFVGPNTGLPDQLMVPLNPVAKKVLNLYPQPNDPTGIYGAGTFLSTLGTPTNMDQGMVRIDHRFSNDKDTLFGEFVLLNNSFPIESILNAAIDRSFSPGREYNQKLASLGWVHVFGPKMINTFHAAWQDSYEIENLDNLNAPLSTLSGPSLYQIQGTLMDYGAGQGGFLEQPEPITFGDDFNLVKGRHSISAGVLYQWLIEDNWEPASQPGIFTFTAGTPLPVAVPSASGQNDLAAGSPSPSPLISLMLGIPSTYTRQVGYPGFTPAPGNNGTVLAYYSTRSFKVNGYIQDDFQFKPSLTFNMGLRYEFNSVPYETKGRFMGIMDDPTFKGGSLYHNLVLNPNPLYFPDYRGFAPRFGLAYKATQKTVLRGGFGIYTNLPINVLTGVNAGSYYLTSASSGLTNPPYSLTALPVPPPAPITDLNGNVLPPGGDISKIPPNTPPLIAFPDCATCRYDVAGPSQHLRNGYTMTGNTTLEQALPGDLAMQVSYVLNNGVGLYYPSWPNGYNFSAPQFRPYAVQSPGVGAIQLLINAGHSTYNALQAVVRKMSPTYGLAFQVSYTWSHLLSNIDGTFWGDQVSSGRFQQNPLCFSCQRGNSDSDIPQRLVANLQYSPPIQRLRLFSAVPRRITQGWQVSSIVSAQSGFPFTVRDPFGVQGWQVGSSSGRAVGLPDVVQTPTYNSDRQGPANQLFSNAVMADALSGNGVYFSAPGCPQYSCEAQSRPGNERRNLFRTQGWSNVDFSVQKTTNITESTKIEFRAEVFNLLNQVAFGIPGTSLQRSDFGLANATVNPSREYEFGLRLVF